MKECMEVRGLTFPKQVATLANEGNYAVLSIVYGVVGLVLSQARIIGSVSPFGVALMSAVPLKFTLPSALGMALGYLLSMGVTETYRYIAAGAVLVILRWLVSESAYDKQKMWLAPTTSMLAVTATAIIPMFYDNPLMYDVIIWCAQIVMAGAVTVFLLHTLSVFATGKLGHLQSLSLGVMAVLFIMGLNSINIMGVSLGHIASILAVLATAKISGLQFSTVVGVLCGFGVGFSSGDFTLYSTFYGLGGLLAGLFSVFGRVGSSIAVTVTYGLVAVLSGGESSRFIEIAVAVSLFMLIPHRYFNLATVSLFDSKDSHGIKALVSEIIDETCTALKEVSTTTHDVSAKLDKLSGVNTANIYDNVGETICRRCPYALKCWNEQYSQTVDILGGTLKQLSSGLAVDSNSFPDTFSHCIKRVQIADYLTQAYQDVLKRDENKRQSMRTRRMFTDQLDGMSALLEDIVEKVSDIYSQDNIMGAKIEELINSYHLEPQRVICWKSKAGVLSVLVEIPRYKQARSSPELLLTELSDICKISMGYPVITLTESAMRMVFKQIPRFAVEHGSHQINCGKNTVCGDSFRILNNPDNTVHLLLSDGMGSGSHAAVDSAMASALIARMLEAGISYDSAMKLMNGALLVKSSQESLATIDAAMIDLYTGKVRFYKAGAVPTIIKHNNRSVEISSTSLPAGIMDGIEFQKSKLLLDCGDIIVMMSDGAVAEDGAWISKMVENYTEQDLDALCAKIAKTAKLRRTDGREDDITVLCCRLIEKQTA